MLSISARNVNDAFAVGMTMLRENGVQEESQHGTTIEYPEPVSIKYHCAYERVLFNKKRAINPFLHFFEPLWILAGQRDVKFLSDIVSRFKEYSDDGKFLYGAYGYRMKNQIQEAVTRLRAYPEDRQAVLMIRNDQDIFYRGKDSPCNVAVACKIRRGRLNIHVFNRSNDFIWGMTGANMPQFSMLQEYIAGKIGVPMGTYHQTTDSMHAYTNLPQWEQLKEISLVPYDPYVTMEVMTFPIFKGCVKDTKKFDEDLRDFFDGEKINFRTEFFSEVVAPMWETMMAHKNGRNGLSFVGKVAAEDWRFVTTQWLKDKEND